jgi:hypothetical protein
MLRGLPAGARDWVTHMSEDSDEFWPGLEEVLLSYWSESPRLAVEKALKTWEDNVKVSLDAMVDVLDSSGERSRLRYAVSRMTLKPKKELIAALVIAACGGEVPSGFMG